MKIRDRIKELRRVPAKELLPNPKNWRAHPPAQKEALQGLLAELGYCDATIARELPDGKLQLIDGHLRCETTPDMEVPVLVLDVSEAEADKLLVTLDPLASLAQADRAALTSLLASVDTDSTAVQALLADLAAGELTAFLDREAVPGLTDPDAIRSRRTKPRPSPATYGSWTAIGCTVATAPTATTSTGCSGVLRYTWCIPIRPTASMSNRDPATPSAPA